MTQLREEGLLLPEPVTSYGNEVQFQQEMQDAHVAGLWNVSPEQAPLTPHPKASPYLWRWQEMSRLAALSWYFVPAEQGISNRMHGRVLTLVNPTVKGLGATDTLTAGIQSLLPGETIRAHRHTMQAIRFIMAGHGASTTVDDERIEMEPGDFILTPGCGINTTTSRPARP